MDILFQTFNTFFGNIASDYFAWIMNWGKIFYLLKTCVASGYFYHTDHAVFFPRPTNIKQNYIQSKRTKMAVLDTSSGAMFPHINEWEAICDFFRYQSRSASPGNPSWRSDTEPMQNICVHCYSQQPFKSTFWSVKSMQK